VSRARTQILLLLVLGWSVAAAGQRSDVRVSEFHATMDVAADGSAVIIERWDLALAQFAPSPVFRRVLPDTVAGPHGSHFPVYLEIISIADDQNRPLKSSRFRWNGELEISTPLENGPAHAATVQISYGLRNLVRDFPDHDEIYWDLLAGNDYSIDRASAMVMLPDAAAPGLRAQAFLVGATRGALLPEVNGSAMQIESGRPLPARTGLLINLFIPPAVFQQPPWLTRAWWFLTANPIVMLPLLVFAVMVALRSARQTSPVVVTTEYEPPPGLSAAEAGMLVDDRFDPRDVTATLIDLAVRGYLRIEVDPQSTPDHRDYILRLLKPREQWGTLANHEQAMIFNIFYGGQWTKLSSLRLRFSVAVPAMQTGVLNALADKGLYRMNPASAQRIRLAAIGALGFLLALSAPWLPLFRLPLPALVSFALSAAIVYFYGLRVSPKTREGMRVCGELEGFREFLNRVDRDRLERVSPQQFEKFLPYAIALGVEHHWAQTFAGIATEVPDWFQSAAGGEFDARLWASGIDAMAQQARTILCSSARGRIFGGAAPEEQAKAAAAAK
jgi:hypothetical protein